MRYFRNLRTYDMLSIQEKRSIAPFASAYLAEELAKQAYAHRRRQQIMLAQRQIENDYEGEEDGSSTNNSQS